VIRLKDFSNQTVSDTVFPKCVLCRSTPGKGIVGGQLVARRFFCDDCLADMIRLSPKDASYNDVLNGLDGLGSAVLRQVYRDCY